MDIKRIFAMRLHNLRVQKDVSQAELGDEIGISRGSISFYEHEDRVADIETLLKLCKYFHVSADYLIGLTDSEEIKIFTEKNQIEHNEIGDNIKINSLALELYNGIKTFMNLIRNYHIDNDIFYSPDSKQPSSEFIPPILLSIFEEFNAMIDVYERLSYDLSGDSGERETVYNYIKRVNDVNFMPNVLEQIDGIFEERERLLKEGKKGKSEGL